MHARQFSFSKNHRDPKTEFFASENLQIQYFTVAWKKIFFYFFLDPKNGQIGHIHLAHLSHSSKIFIMCTESSHLHFLEILNTPSWNFLHIHMNYMHNMQLKYLIWLLHARIEKLKKIHLKILRIYLKKLIYKFNKVTWYMHNCTYPETSKNKEPRNKKYPSTCVYCLTSGNMLVSAVVIITPIGTCCKSQPFLIFLKGTVSREKVNGLRAASDLTSKVSLLFLYPESVSPDAS